MGRGDANHVSRISNLPDWYLNTCFQGSPGFKRNGDKTLTSADEKPRMVASSPVPFRRNSCKSTPKLSKLHVGFLFSSLPTHSHS
ncbi:hypothetical protein AGIG_G19693 [Arapaima gigas]